MVQNLRYSNDSPSYMTLPFVVYRTPILSSIQMNLVQWGSEIRTCPDFEWWTLVLFSNGRQFFIASLGRFSLIFFLTLYIKWHKLVVFWTPFWTFTIRNPDIENVQILNVSGFQMVRFRIPTVFRWLLYLYHPIYRADRRETRDSEPSRYVWQECSTFLHWIRRRRKDSWTTMEDRDSARASVGYAALHPNRKDGKLRLPLMIHIEIPIHSEWREGFQNWNKKLSRGEICVANFIPTCEWCMSG